ncbi:MAG: alpha/beta hydrolase [Bacteroidia bacterium]
MSKSHSTFFLFLLLCLATIMTACQRESITDPGHLVPLTVDENPDLPAIEINGTRLHAWALGEVGNPVIITLHGGPGGDHMELQKFEVLADSGYRVVFWDQRSAGLSRRHNPDVLTESMYLEDLKQLIDYYTQSPEEKVILLGHSWGAMYATMFVNTYPERVKGLILSEPGGFTNTSMLDYVKRTQAISLTPEWSNDLVWMEQVMSPSAKWFSTEDHELFDYQYLIGAGITLQQSFSDKESTGGYPVQRFGAMVGYHLRNNTPYFDWTTRLDQYTSPVLFFYSELNPGYNQEHLKTMTEVYPNITIHRIDNVGHDLMVNGFDSVLPIVTDYLKHR